MAPNQIQCGSVKNNINDLSKDSGSSPDKQTRGAAIPNLYGYVEALFE